MNILRLLVLVATLTLIACKNPEADWKKAEADNTEVSWQAFLERHPEGEWAEKAQAELDALKDNRDWDNAQTADNIEAYDNYLVAHPTGAHLGEARQRISELETETAWLTAQSAGTREALEDFLLRHADAPQAEQARAQIDALIPAPAPEPPPAPAAKQAAKSKAATASKPPAAASAPVRPRGSWHLQLGAFSTQGKAQSEKTRIEKRFAATTGPLSISAVGADSLYRLKSAGMTEAAARSACDRLKGAGQDCMVSHP
jgi:cell division septation protein DedD